MLGAVLVHEEVVIIVHQSCGKHKEVPNDVTVQVQVKLAREESLRRLMQIDHCTHDVRSTHQA